MSAVGLHCHVCPNLLTIHVRIAFVQPELQHKSGLQLRRPSASKILPSIHTQFATFVVLVLGIFPQYTNICSLSLSSLVLWFESPSFFRATVTSSPNCVFLYRRGSSRRHTGLCIIFVFLRNKQGKYRNRSILSFLLNISYNFDIGFCETAGTSRSLLRRFWLLAN